MAKKEKPNYDQEFYNIRVDIVIKNVSLADYKQIRKKYIQLGYDVQGYQEGFYQDTKKELIKEQ